MTDCCGQQVPLSVRDPRSEVISRRLADQRQQAGEYAVRVVQPVPRQHVRDPPPGGFKGARPIEVALVVVPVVVEPMIDQHRKTMRVVARPPHGEIAPQLGVAQVGLDLAAGRDQRLPQLSYVARVMCKVPDIAEPWSGMASR